MDAHLLNSHEAVSSDRLTRQHWVDYSRAVLIEEGDSIKDRSLEDRLSLAAASYDLIFNRLGNPKFKAGEWDKLHQAVRALSTDQQALLVQDFELHNLALRNMKVPEPYFQFLNAIHAEAYQGFLRTPVAQELLPKWSSIAGDLLNKTGDIKTYANGSLRTPEEDWFQVLSASQAIMTERGRQRLDQTGITAPKCVELMNAASIAINDAWINFAKTELRVDIQARPLRAIGVAWDSATAEEKQTLQNVKEDKDGSYYLVSDKSLTLLDFRNLIHIAFHEPQHGIQKHLMALHKAGTTMPGWLGEACHLFSHRQDFRLKSAPPFVFFVTDQLKDLAIRAYGYSSTEETALHQGHVAELDFTQNYAPSIAGRTRHTFTTQPQLLVRLPADIQSWFLRSHPPSSQTVPASALRSGNTSVLAAS